MRRVATALPSLFAHQQYPFSHPSYYISFCHHSTNNNNSNHNNTANGHSQSNTTTTQRQQHHSPPRGTSSSSGNSQQFASNGNSSRVTFTTTVGTSHGTQQQQHRGQVGSTAKNATTIPTTPVDKMNHASTTGSSNAAVKEEPLPTSTSPITSVAGNVSPTQPTSSVATTATTNTPLTPSSSSAPSLELAVKQQREAAIALHRRTSALELLLNDHTQQISRIESILNPLHESQKRTNVKLGQMELHMERVKQRADQCTLELSEMSRREAQQQQRNKSTPLAAGVPLGVTGATESQPSATPSSSPTNSMFETTKISEGNTSNRNNTFNDKEVNIVPQQETRNQREVTVSRREWEDLTQLVRDLVAQVASLQEEKELRQQQKHNDSVQSSVKHNNETVRSDLQGTTDNETIATPAPTVSQKQEKSEANTPTSTATTTTTQTTATVLFEHVPLTCSAAMLRAMCTEALVPFTNNPLHSNNNNNTNNKKNHTTTATTTSTTRLSRDEMGVLSVLAGPSSPLKGGSGDHNNNSSGDNGFAMSRRLYVTVSSLCAAQCIVQRLDGRPWQMKTSAGSSVQAKGEKVLLSCRIAVGSSTS